MSNASTRAHVESTIAQRHIPVADLPIEKLQTPQDSDSDYHYPIARTPPLNRKERRMQRRQEKRTALPTPSDTDNEINNTSANESPSGPPKKKNKNKKQRSAGDETLEISIPLTMPPAKEALQKFYPLLVCSIGNPGATYANTLHSAGHVVTSYLAERKYYKPFTKGMSGLVSRPDQSTRSFSIIGGYSRVDGGAPSADDDWTFWQSTNLMNVSGASVKKAYNEWMRSVRAASGSNATEGRLVVIHDELESNLGKVTVRDGSASPKGHNGLKSCQSHLGGTKWWRIAVGIGRPESRDPNVVSKYVLGKMSSTQRGAIENSSASVFRALQDISAGKK